MEKALEIIKSGKGIQSIVNRGGFYEIHYYTRQGNIALVEGSQEEVSGILEYNASLPSFKQKKVQNR